MASLSGNLATMGPGVPYAIAAKFAYPDRPVVAMVGDGAMQMNGINGLITIAKYWKEWNDPRLVILVLKNLDLNQVTWEQRVFSGDPKFPGSQDVPPFPYAEYARSLGLEGVSMERPDQVGPGWDRVLAATRPVVVEARTDPNVPPMPPHLTFKQMNAYTKSLLRGDPDRRELLTASIREMASTLWPHKS